MKQQDLKLTIEECCFLDALMQDYDRAYKSAMSRARTLKSKRDGIKSILKRYNNK